MRAPARRDKIGKALTRSTERATMVHRARYTHPQDRLHRPVRTLNPCYHPRNDPDLLHQRPHPHVHNNARCPPVRVSSVRHM